MIYNVKADHFLFIILSFLPKGNTQAKNPSNESDIVIIFQLLRLGWNPQIWLVRDIFILNKFCFLSPKLCLSSTNFIHVQLYSCIYNVHLYFYMLITCYKLITTCTDLSLWWFKPQTSWYFGKFCTWKLIHFMYNIHTVHANLHVHLLFTVFLSSLKISQQQKYQIYTEVWRYVGLEIKT